MRTTRTAVPIPTRTRTAAVSNNGSFHHIGTDGIQSKGLEKRTNEALFSGLDDGSSQWENIPTVVRGAIRHLIIQSNTSREERDEARVRNDILAARVEALEVELSHRSDTLAALIRDLSTRPTRADVAVKADADSVAVVSAQAAEASGAAAGAAAAIERVARDLTLLRTDAQAGVTAAAGAANEARLAVNTALSAITALLARGEIERTTVSSAFDDVRGASAALSRETAALANRLETQLCKKAVASRVGAALAALATRVDLVEKEREKERLVVNSEAVGGAGSASASGTVTTTADLVDQVEVMMRECAAQLGGLRADVAAVSLRSVARGEVEALISEGVNAAIMPMREKLASLDVTVKLQSR